MPSPSADYNHEVNAHRARVNELAAAATPERRGVATEIVTALALVLCLPGDWIHLNAVTFRRWTPWLLPLAFVCSLSVIPFALLRRLLFTIGAAFAKVGASNRFGRLTTWPALPSNAAVDATVRSGGRRRHYAVDVIIVPGYAHDGFSDALTPRGRERLKLAARDFFCGRAPFILVSGGNVHPHGTLYNEAFEMRRCLIDELRVPADRVIVEPLAEHTPTNLRNAGRYMLTHGLRTALVVSDRETFGQSIMLQAPNSLIFGVRTRMRWFFGHEIGRLRRVDNARTLFVPSRDVMLTKRLSREP